jgi:hypothetical protein
MYRVRFHLGAGAHYMHWQITHPDGSVTYHAPSTCTLTIRQGRLRNQPGTAARIHAGANKTVCAWIEAEKVDVKTDIGSLRHARYMVAHGSRHAAYNPRVAPHWVLDKRNVDGRRFPVIFTADSRAFVPAWA